jgi:alkylation response protein AidB-like acyl-CoA dehydrogenase
VLVPDVTFNDDDPAPRAAWLRTHAEALAGVPLPGDGRTGDRWRTLAAIAAADGSLARLAEGHLDALAIMTELSAPPGDDRLRGVWAARPELLHARPTAHGWRLAGTKPWCSGADRLERALLTATDPDGAVRLFDVPVEALRFADDWHPIGMRASDSRTACIEVDVAGGDQIGPPGAYVGRPGFWHGGIGVAACWHGLASRIGRELFDHAARRDDPFTRAAAGRAAAALAGARSLLAAAGRQIDRRPDDEAAARRRAPLVRVAVAEGARSVLDASVVAQGASALCFDAGHGRAVADLTVYLGQLHHGTDAATIDPAAAGDEWWSA